jgi:hypothetical protein
MCNDWSSSLDNHAFTDIYALRSFSRIVAGALAAKIVAECAQRKLDR